MTGSTSSYWAPVAVAFPDEAEFLAAAGTPHDPDRTLGLVRMLAGTGEMFAPALALMKAVFAEDGLDPKLRQVLMLRMAVIRNAPYEWQMNATLARNSGLTNGEITAIAATHAVTGLAPAYQLACRAVDELSATNRLGDETLNMLIESFGDAVTRRIVLVIGWAHLASLFTNGCRIPMEETDKLRGRPSPV